MQLEVAWLASIAANAVRSAGYFPRLTTFGGRSQGGVLARAVLLWGPNGWQKRVLHAKLGLEPTPWGLVCPNAAVVSAV